MEFTNGPSSTTSFRRSTSGVNFFNTTSKRQPYLTLHVSAAIAYLQDSRGPNHFIYPPPKMAQTPQIRSIYRRLLRELPSTPQTTRTQHQKLSSPSKLQQRIRCTLSRSPTNGSAQSQLQQAEQFIQYVQAQRTHSTLLERYNPGMGMTEEERVRLSARRVGMNLPVEFEEEK